MPESTEKKFHVAVPSPDFSPPASLAALGIGSVGTLILGLQPMLLGALLSERRVDFDGLAMIATLEIIAIGLGSAVFALLFKADRMRGKSVILLIAAAIGQFVTADAEGLGALLLVRGATGLIEGGLVAVAVELIARTPSPSKTGGHYVLIQTLAQSALAAILALFILPHGGSGSGFRLLSVVSLLAIGLVPLAPPAYGALAPSEDGATSGPFRIAPVAALACIFSLYLFIGAIWAFLEPLGGQFGIDAATVGLIVSLSLLVQVVGAFCATLLERRLSYRSVIATAALGGILISIGFATGPDASLFWALSLATGFLWLFVVPWQIGMTIAADESRRTALLVPAAQLFGAALGPAGASAFMNGSDFRPVAWFGAVSSAASLALVLFLILWHFLEGKR